MNGVSSKDLRERNILAVMQAVRRIGPASRGDLAEATGLDRSTMTHITGALLEAGLIAVAARAPASARGGRRAEMLTLSCERHAIAGFDIRAGGARWVLAGLDGAVIEHGTIGPSIPATSGATRSAWLAAIMDDLRNAADGAAARRLPSPSIIGSGVALPGLMDRRQQTLIESFELGLSAIDLTAAWGAPALPVLFDNDASCYTWREIAADRATADGIYVYTKFHRNGEAFTATGLGIGVMVVTDGRIRRGAHGSAGELRGYAWTPTGGDQLGVTLEELRLRDGEHAALTVAATELVRNLGVLASVLDPARVVIAGDLCAGEEPLATALAADGHLLDDAVELRRPSRLELAEGAARMVIERLFSGTSADPRLSFATLLM